MQREKRKLNQILEDAGPIEKFIWLLNGINRIIESHVPRHQKRVWRFIGIRISRHPLIIGLELVLLIGLLRLAGGLAGYSLAGGLLGAAAAVANIDDITLA